MLWLTGLIWMNVCVLYQELKVNGTDLMNELKGGKNGGVQPLPPLDQTLCRGFGGGTSSPTGALVRRGFGGKPPKQGFSTNDYFSPKESDSKNRS